MSGTKGLCARAPDLNTLPEADRCGDFWPGMSSATWQRRENGTLCSAVAEEEKTKSPEDSTVSAAQGAGW